MGRELTARPQAAVSECWDAGPALLRDLLAVQQAMALSGDRSLIVRRARLMAAGGCPAAARIDAQGAVAEDPSDPQALLLHASLADDGRHDAALEVIASPFATQAQRQAALVHVDPDRLPAALTCDLAATLRLTLLQRPADPCSLRGMEPSDLALGLGRSGDMVATDMHLARDSHRTRGLDVRVGAALHHVTVAALPGQVIVATDPATAPLWIILPVRDGGAALSDCLGSLAPECAALPGCRVIIIDDASSEAATLALLDDWRRRPGVRVLATGRPTGFTGAVNLGLAAVGQGPVLLLNSDTYLPRGTLRRLLAHLADPTIGTVTPLSNNAGSFSVPAPRVAHAMPDAAACTAIAAEAWRRNRGVAIDVLTGNGFCMLISAPCLAATGALSTHYDSGYFEEVDFCLRARVRGFRHVAATDCFVGHVGAASYGAARHRLVAANRRRIAARHPSYPADYMRFALADPLAPFRARLTCAAGLRPQGPHRHQTDLPPREVRVKGPVLPVQGAQAAWRGVAGALRAAGLLAVPADSLRAGGLELRPVHGLTAAPTPGGGLRIRDAAGRPFAEVTDASGAMALARQLATATRAEDGSVRSGTEVDGLSF